MVDLHLGGILPPIPTPFNRQCEVAYPQLAENLARWNDYDLAGYVVLGSNGEAVYLDAQEKLRVLEVARQAIPRNKLLIAGTGCESTRETLALTRQAADVGANAALVITPHFFEMTPDALVRYFQAVAEASPIPVIVYNVPKFTHVDMSAATLARVAQHPNIIGVKDSSGDVAKLSDVVRLAGASFQVLVGTASVLLAGLTMGAVGGVVALGNVAPQQSIDIFRLFQAGKMDEAAELQRRMLPVNAAVTTRFGVAGLKAALDMLGYYGGPVRPPLLDLTGSELQALRDVLVAGGVLD